MSTQTGSSQTSSPEGESAIHDLYQQLLAGWNRRSALFQNTPAQFHGRPELVEALTEELRQLL